MPTSILGFSRVRAETSMGRGNQIARHWQIIRWLERFKSGVTIADLSRDLLQALRGTSFTNPFKSSGRHPGDQAVAFGFGAGGAGLGARGAADFDKEAR